MKTKKLQVAICYDFDGTLAAGNMQEYGFMNRLSVTPDVFWAKSAALVKQHSADRILCYMKCMLEEAKARKIPFKREDFVECGKDVALFKGVTEWFDRIDTYSKSKGVEISHFLISSGLQEIVEGTPIAGKFKKLYASTFMYNEYGEAQWPARTIDYTGKTQYLFRINKGCLDVNDNVSVNHKMSQDERPVPFSHMIYFGDGDTDVPCMSMIKGGGGYCVAVYQPHKHGAKEVAEQYLRDGRVDIVAPADYSEGKKIDRFVKQVIDTLSAANKLNSFE